VGSRVMTQGKGFQDARSERCRGAAARHEVCDGR